MARKALGRGLDALIPSGAGGGKKGGGDGGEGIVLCDIDMVSPSPLQPRQEFEPGALKELAESIKTQGILQPLLVRPKSGGGWELIAGERRLRAARLAGISVVPAVVREADDKNALELSLVENLQREDLDPLDEALSYRRLMSEFGYTQEEVSKRVGKERATVGNILRLLNLPDDIQNDLRAKRISAGHARALLMAGAPSLMRTIRDAVVNDGISVREAEQRAQLGKPAKKKSAGKEKGKSAAGRDVHIHDMEENLLRALGTRVRIIGKGKGGKIEIRFYSADDLDRIYRRITG